MSCLRIKYNLWKQNKTIFLLFITVYTLVYSLMFNAQNENLMTPACSISLRPELLFVSFFASFISWGNVDSQKTSLVV